MCPVSSVLHFAPGADVAEYILTNNFIWIYDVDHVSILGVIYFILFFLNPLC